MTKKEKYQEFMQHTALTGSITSSLVAHELLARAILKILMDKKIINMEEYMKAMIEVTGWFVDLHTHNFVDANEPNYLDLTSDN